MSGTVSDEIAVKVPASEAWKLYGTLQLAQHVQEALPGIISKIDVVEGDGSVGTVLELFLPPGNLRSDSSPFLHIFARIWAEISNLPP